MMKRNFAVFLSIGFALVISSLLIGRVHAQSAQAAPDAPKNRYVSPNGSDTSSCLMPDLPCRSVQYAIGVAKVNDEIRVATGTYTTTTGTVAFIQKNLTLFGGWSADFTQRDPAALPTTLDAQGLGSVIRISGMISPTIDGFFITNGDASLNPNDPGKGGGIYSLDASPIIQNNVIFGNLAHTSENADGYGGGIYLLDASTSALISANEVYSNTASTGYIGWGGGIYLESSAATVQGNTVYGNMALSVVVGTSPPGPLSASREGETPPSDLYQGSGGGIGAVYGTPLILDNVVTDNIASTAGRGGGGGIYAADGTPTITGNTVSGNLSSPVGDGVGGGIAVYNSQSPLVSGNTVRDNIASQANIGKGGGIGLKWTWDAVVSDNLVTGNLASTSFAGHGGGLFIKYSEDAVVSNNTVLSNTASLEDLGEGGGIFVHFGDVTVQGNLLSGNVGAVGGQGEGGGLHTAEAPVRILDNTLDDNTASIEGVGYGGGMYIFQATPTVDGNLVFSNVASLAADSGYGGGIFINDTATFTLTNNIVHSNQANVQGGGVEVYGVRELSAGNLVNNTIADNTPRNYCSAGGGEGVYLSGPVTLTLINNLIAGQTVGIYLSGDSSANAGYTLLNGNGSDTGGEGNITNLNPVYGDPAFVDPANGDYHIQTASAAIDAGDPAGAPPAPASDFDGEARPLGEGVDIGADEVPPALPAMHVSDITLQYRPTKSMVGAQITIVDADGQRGTVVPTVPDVAVTVQWSLPDGATRTQQSLTNPAGQALFRTRAVLSGTYTITVLDVVKEGWFYDAAANNETSDFIVVP